MKSIQAKSSSEHYDELPYQSYSFPITHPARLAAVAKLFGLTPPTHDKFRVLELGCASGGNLIPLALHYPEVELVGIDYSTVQIKEGQTRIEKLGLDDRVQLICQSITEIKEDLGDFDYIICHGVYSWVPQEVQGAILKTIRKHLKPEGLAYVSYNVYPGWKRLEILRDMMIYHTRAMGERPVSDRLAQGRAIVDFFQGLAHENSSLRQMIDAPWEGLKVKSDYYIGHEFLESVNQPCYFLDFVDELKANELSYLVDAEPSQSFLQNLPEEKAEELIQASHNSQVMLEQYLDFLYFNQFRRSVIVHAEQEAKIRRQVDASVFEELDYTVQSCVEKGIDNQSPDSQVVDAKATKQADSSSQTHQFLINQHQTITTSNPIDYAFMRTISQVGTKPFSHQELVSSNENIADARLLRQRAANLLNRLALTGNAAIWSQLPPTLPSFEKLEKPYIPTQLRDYIEQFGYVSNYLHGLFQPNIIQKILIPKLDGKHDRNALHEHLLEQLKAGAIKLLDQDDKPLADDRVEEALYSHLDQALEIMRMAGLLYKNEVDEE